jgi:3-oxoacyl-[acyl-carrier-protein] synthase-3
MRFVPRGTGHAIPKKIVTNDDLSKLMATSDEWIKTRTGIERRHIAEKGLSTSDLGTAAAQEAMDQAGWKAHEVDLILAATLSPDFYFPGLGVLIQSKLGCKPIPALDIRGQCAGFVWSLATAQAYGLTGHYKKILVIGAEIHSTVIDWSDAGRNIAVLFGDGAGALALELEPGAPELGKRGLIDFVMGSDGAGVEALCMKRPGMGGEERFVTHEDIDAGRVHPEMDGKKVYVNAVARMCESVSTLMSRHGLSESDVDLLIPHQANLRINESVREKLGFPEEKVVNIIADYGNTTAATIPLCMYHAVRDGRLKPGQLVITTAFGAGFSWGANLIRW